MIDLRSDTFTVPDAGMREAMASAQVGDDVFGEDPTVNMLEEKVAAYFGKEATLFVPSGTMGNQLGIRVNVEDGDEVICENEAHIYYYETAAPSLISRIQLRPLLSEYGSIPISSLESAIRPDIYYFPKTSLVSLESSHNRHGGTVLPIDYIDQVESFSMQNKLKLHLDGARIWNALAYLESDPIEYVKAFDTISVCFSKGLGAPVGSALVGTKEAISKAKKWRKILGGGMRQAGIIAAAAIYAMDFILPNIKKDNDKALFIGKEISKEDKISLKIDTVHTNILRFSVSGIDEEWFVDKCKENGLCLLATGKTTYRIVLHHQISDEMVDDTVKIIKSIVRNHK
ncbi:MAG: low-specificity L-threonine aldolase [Candidatus Kapaibacteriales bacterium]